jgi:hypothetical protein
MILTQLYSKGVHGLLVLIDVTTGSVQYSVVDLRALFVQDSLWLKQWAGQLYLVWNRGLEAEMGLS